MLNKINVVKGLPSTYKKQHTKFSVEVVAAHRISLGQKHYAVLEAVLAAPEAEYKALAGYLGVPVGTVKSRLNRARAKLNKLLGDAG